MFKLKSYKASAFIKNFVRPLPIIKAAIPLRIAALLII